jgi:hypothetical protein
MTGNSAGLPGGKILALLGIFFGIGFMTGFFTGYGYRPAMTAQGGAAGAGQGGPLKAASPDAAAYEDGETLAGQDVHDGPPEWGESLPDSGLALEEHGLDEDENGLFVYGTILNRSSHSYDAVRVTFDLCDASGNAYSGITDVTYDKMSPGDSWGFVIYIPYAEMGLFSSYRLQSIIGAAR